MSNINKFAPYAYLAKRGGSTLYDLLLLVPVDASGDTNLSSVTPVKPGGTQIKIDYTTTGIAANEPYRFKHWVIDSEGTYLDIKIQGNNSADLTTVLAFADADTELATVIDQIQTCAPYLSYKIETVGSQKLIRLSCIIKFDGGLGVQSEVIVFTPNSASATFTLENGSPTTDPTKFAINQTENAALTPNQTYTFVATILANVNAGKPPRKSIIKAIL
ncbi:MAG: hypothetical protein ACKVU0_15455 [Saprospiraceae bacterium]